MTPDDPNATLGGTPKPRMAHTQAAIQAFKALPPERQASKVWSTLYGLVTVAVFIGLRVWLGAVVPWYVVIGGVAFGGMLTSRELFVTGAKTFIGLVRDLVAAIGGKSADPPPPPAQ